MKTTLNNKTKIINGNKSHMYEYFNTMTFHKEVSKKHILNKINGDWLRLNAQLFEEKSSKKLPPFSVILESRNNMAYSYIMVKIKDVDKFIVDDLAYWDSGKPGSDGSRLNRPTPNFKAVLNTDGDRFYQYLSSNNSKIGGNNVNNQTN